MKPCLIVLPAVIIGLVIAGNAADKPDGWTRIDTPDTTRGVSPALFFSEKLGRFVCLLGSTAHDFKGERPYEAQSFDLPGGRWINELPAAAAARGGETGNVTQVRFQSPYFSMQDVENLTRPHPHHGTMYYQYAVAPWDGCCYALLCGHLVKYDPEARVWTELKPAGETPAPESGTRGGSLCWASLAADPVNREIVLFGGCGVPTPDGSPGTWVYATKKNEWRRLDLALQPPARALSPMAYHPGSRKIVLFGGDALDTLLADTWLYDTGTRTWSEARPATGPGPRFGHALLALPKSGRILLLGGKGYTSSTSYLAMLYRPLPMELWTYDVEANQWSLLSRQEEGGPPVAPHGATVAAADKDDTVLLLGAPQRRYDPHETWTRRIDTSRADEALTATFSVPAGTVEHRTGPYDPAWYKQDVPPPDPAANEARLAKLAPNRWLALECPKWPENRMGGGWSTVTLDPAGDQILHMGGGHSSYFGNDVAHYHIPTGRWSIAARPQTALDFNYDLSGPGPWAFNGAPWGNHNYQAYEFDPARRRLVYLKVERTLFYDPATRTWPHAEKLAGLPFLPSKYVNYLCHTPGGIVCWTQTAPGSSKTGLWRLEGEQRRALELSGDPLPMTVTDGSTVSYDSKRDRLLFTTTPEKNSTEPTGQVWACDLKTGMTVKLSPSNAAVITGERFAREAVYLPKQDLVMFGYLIEAGGRRLTPFYDCAANRWLMAEMPGSDFMAPKDKAGASVDLGLVYDAKRDLVWGVLCRLSPGSLHAIRVSREGLAAE